ncbi:VasL domain-containing protein [Providencia stuartii]|uniref:VasL domain-containing protein n=1 Tax=Providencia TaxID=586 RepID=UPI00234950AD|nr:MULTISPECIES: VasL domain-containing protein [Providencia]MCR4080543.1 type VI secretion system ImpA family N-terminal domain-containing protein [Providencia stuartii]
MSTQSENLVIKVGGAPLETPEFIALKTEFNKLNHPARPEVSWTLIESLCLTLFKTHGIDLQSGIYYTIARLQLHGLNGFTEGCELLASVVVTQWDHLWPEQPHHRADILNWFNSRAGSALRQISFKTSDLRLIYRSERALQLIIDKLAQTTWTKVPKLENLLWFFQNSAKNLEQRENALNQNKGQTVKLPPLVYIQQPKTEQEPPAQSIVIETAAQKRPSSPMPTQEKMSATKGFFLGLLSSAVIFSGIGYALYYSTQQEVIAMASVPEGAAAQWLYKPELTTYADNLGLLEKQSPIFTLKLADSLVDVAKKRWPNNADQAYVSRNWQNLITTRLENAPISDSWSETATLLQQLSDKIVMQERNRGSFTLSYLKTAIYDIQKQHNKSTPVEERLREFSLQIENDQPISPTLISNIDSQINGLLARYYDLQKQAEERGLKPNSY